MTLEPKLNMIIKKYIIVCLSMVLLSSCGSTRNTVNFSKVRQGEQLEKASEISVEEFLEIWMNNHYPIKIDINCHELYKGEDFTYFGINEMKILNLVPHLFKVNNDSLKIMLGNYTNIDGQLIRQEFWERIVPKTDLDARKNSECSSGTSSPNYTYELIDHKIRIRLHWIIKCDGRKILDKNYSGHYDLKTMKIE